MLDPAALAKDPLTTRRSLNLVQLVALFALAGAIAVVVFLLTNLVVFPPRRTLTPTEVNTILNRRENGGTGVFARKWRRRLLPARQFGDEDVLADADIDARDALDNAQKWRMRSTSPPPGLRSCLKSALAAPSPSTSSGDEPLAPARPAKHVRIAEPSLVGDLEALRERWASPDMQGEQGHGGIGGYRSTRDFVVARGKGAAASPAAKPVPAAATAGAAVDVLLPGKAIPATTADEDESAFEIDEDDAEPLARRLQRHHPHLSAHTSRTSSNSPSPLGRRRRALSPASLHPSSSSTARSSSPAFVVGHHSTTHKASPSRRRALSPNTAASSPWSARSHSVSPGADRAAPRWVRTKGGKLASPAPVRWAVSVEAGSGSDVEDEEDEGEIELEDAATDLEDDDDKRPSPPRGISTQLAGIAAVAAVVPPLPPSASLRLVSPPGSASPALSILSGGESPQESPTPSPARLPALSLTPSSPPAPVAQPLVPAPATSAAVSPSPSPSVDTPSSTSTSSTALSSASSSSPSPSIGAERRLSLRVEQALRDQQGKRRPSRELELQVGAGAGRSSALTV
ncbi:uncharacterized protein RHOBADRAFT_42131 [Rhodotorula graminis WP1]|uniref:Uncharacterized protein n=1 Tax=Rhodotorula graminis (strain WP1) TaxID=578459 RepID=A0A194S861_RHOGW|nr:uncharacterized protein RHOBADRAFT_42131 [Rhodotorula graminis WP1]KPV76918.1 hypothetical protein RHOBADRAFT_42131 [Rhodotorula graminis WP1]